MVGSNCRSSMLFRLKDVFSAVTWQVVPQRHLISYFIFHAGSGMQCDLSQQWHLTYMYLIMSFTFGFRYPLTCTVMHDPFLLQCFHHDNQVPYRTIPQGHPTAHPGRYGIELRSSS